MTPDDDYFIRLILSQKSLSNRYTPLELISDKGHFSYVFKCRDNVLNEDVAIKCFDVAKRNDVYRLRCFYREAELLQQFKGQKNIIELIEGLSTHKIVIQDNNSGLEIELPCDFIVLELAQSDIQTYIYEVNDDPISKLAYFRELCKAVFRIHRNGILHRDLKPENFLICKNEKIKLSDLGTAIDLDGGIPFKERYTLPVGDIGYSAPELFCGIGIRDDIAFSADIFSLGAILFEIFTKTQLCLKIYDQSLLQSLMGLGSYLLKTKKADRLKVFDGVIDTIVTSRRLPDIYSYNDLVPNSIKCHLNDLYKGMTHLNYNNRFQDSQSIFRKIEISILVLKNELKNRRWKEFKKRRMEKGQC